MTYEQNHAPKRTFSYSACPRGSEYHIVNTLNVIAPYKYLGT